ncbi:MAG: hypothetical protein JST12_15970 [Armatimonadetes bacterium]|nr:hypothetical protein [Armatimonadota bacterium]
MLIAAYTLMAVLSVLIFGCTYLPAWTRWLLIPISLVMADDFRRGFSIPFLVFAGMAAVAFLLIWQAVRKEKTTWLRGGTLILELLGYAGIATCIGALSLFRANPPAPKSQALNAHKTGPRIVVAVFDELDPVHTLEKWPSQYPPNEFLDLAKRSLDFTNCLEPGPETLYSLPAMTIGHTVERAKAAGPQTLNLIVGGKKREWNEKPNILLEARDTVGASAMGWYHPYDREFPGVEGRFYERVSDDPTFCFWLLFDFLVERPFQMVGKNSQTKMLNTFYSNWQRKIIEDFHAQVPSFIDEHHGLIFLHVPCPHVPYVMHPIPGDPLGFDPESYYGAVDYAGEICKTMEDTLAKTGEPYTFIATSDHNLRATLHGIKPCGRVPMLISGTNIVKPGRVNDQACGEHLADVVRLLISNPNASELDIVRAMTAKRVAP